MKAPIDEIDAKKLPLATGCLDYFPDALKAVSHVSYVGNEQHNPGEPLHWAKEKSQTEADSCMRHLENRFDLDTDGAYHAAKAAWRILAFLQKFIESQRLGMTYERYNEYLREKKAADEGWTNDPRVAVHMKL